MVAGVWSVGVEREVASGCYAKLAHEIDGWRLWQFETAGGRYFTAAKAAEGERAVEPIGVAQAIYGGSPRIHVHLTQTLHASFHGTHIHSTQAEIRVAGERFMQEVRPLFDPRPFAEKRLEVEVTSMPGPRSFTKMVKDAGFIDMKGLIEIIAARKNIADAPN